MYQTDLDDSRSTEAAIDFGPKLVSWWSRKQIMVSRSSTKIEYRSLAIANLLQLTYYGYRLFHVTRAFFV